MQAKRGPERGLDPFHRVGAVQQHAGMAGAHRGGRRAVGRDLQGQHRGEDTLFGAFGVQHLFELWHPVRGVHAGERERAPGDPQCRAQGRFVGAVAGDVTDQDVGHPVRRLHDVVEISTQQRVRTAGPITGDDVDTRLVQQTR